MHANTQRDVVFNVMLPPGSMAFDVSVDGVAGSDPHVGVMEDPSCYQPVNACVDDGGDGVCEELNALNPDHFFSNSTYVVVSEPMHSMTEWVVKQKEGLDVRVYDVPDDIEEWIASLKLQSMGIVIDELTEEQKEYLSSWEIGT